MYIREVWEPDSRLMFLFTTPQAIAALGCKGWVGRYITWQSVLKEGKVHIGTGCRLACCHEKVCARMSGSKYSRPQIPRQACILFLKQSETPEQVVNPKMVDRCDREAVGKHSELQLFMGFDHLHVNMISY